MAFQDEKDATITEEPLQEGKGKHSRTPESYQWDVDLCEIKSCSWYCWLACCCPQCALALARADLDGSDICVNLFCISPVNVRWMVRTALGIEGSGEHDCCVTCFCLQCVANQTLQTTRSFRRTFPTVDRNAEWIAEDRCAKWWKFGHCLNAFFCLQCSVALALEEGVGMPCWMGCCCTTPCGGRSIMKSHYRLGATWRNDCCEDCLAPSAAYLCTHSLPPISWFLSAFYFTRYATMMTWEVKGRSQKRKQDDNNNKHHPPESTTSTSNRKWVTSRPGDSERRYLADYLPPKDDDFYNIGLSPASSTVRSREPLQPSSTIV